MTELTELTELIVLVDEDGAAVGTAPKATSHHASTPLHLAFSSYVFDRQGRFLLTQRALSKKTWPGVWTNSCCGHPMPQEPTEQALHRRLDFELGLHADEVIDLLPDFRYRAELDGVVENEICPVFGVRVNGEPTLRPSEVEQSRWLDWDDVLAGRTPQLSPWCVLQLQALAGHPGIERLRTPV
jgi:isopentenyl-diphosphate delta-isomerase